MSIWPGDKELTLQLQGGQSVVNVAGVDYSTRAVDIVTVSYDSDGPPRWARLNLQGNDAFDRTRDVANAMFPRGSGWWDSIVAVGIEHPGGRYGTGDMLRIQGAILSCIPARMLVEPWPPAKWRKAVGLPGNASKEYVADVMRIAWPDYTKGWPQDAIDAYCVALATRQAITTTQAA